MICLAEGVQRMLVWLLFKVYKYHFLAQFLAAMGFNSLLSPILGRHYSFFIFIFSCLYCKSTPNINVKLGEFSQSEHPCNHLPDQEMDPANTQESPSSYLLPLWPKVTLAWLIVVTSLLLKTITSPLIFIPKRYNVVLPVFWNSCKENYTVSFSVWLLLLKLWNACVFCCTSLLFIHFHCCVVIAPWND